MTSSARSKPRRKVPAARPSQAGLGAASTRRVASPLYARIADELTRAILSGRYAVGALLPTEHELCQHFGSSRFTVREALRRLAEAGLVSRRPRAGTVVVSRSRKQPYVQALDSIDDLLQYSSDTDLRMIERGTVTHRVGAVPGLPFPAGETWVFAVGLRHRPGDAQPVCLTRVYLNPDFRSIARRLLPRSVPIYQLIEDHFGVKVSRVEQRILASALSRADALALQTKPAAPALRILRLYYGDGDRLLEVSDSLHPAERFTYAMTIRRAGAGASSK